MGLQSLAQGAGHLPRPPHLRRRQRRPPEPGPDDPAGDVEEVEIGSVHPGDPEDTGGQGPKGYVVNRSAQLVLPYLPDPAAAGVALRGLPGIDPGRDLWYCGIQLDMDRLPGYWPFIRLTLARYQPMSIDADHELSRVVIADFSQLAPDRFLTLMRDEDTIRVMVRGQGPRTEPPHPMAFLFETAPTPDPDELDWTVLNSADPPAGPGDYVWATFSGDELVWQWHAKIPPEAGEEALRLAIREYELLPVDPGTEGAGQGPAAESPDAIARVVYADALRLR